MLLSVPFSVSQSRLRTLAKIQKSFPANFCTTRMALLLSIPPLCSPITSKQPGVMCYV